MYVEQNIQASSDVVVFWYFLKYRWAPAYVVVISDNCVLYY